jgi:hypothetical protein
MVERLAMRLATSLRVSVPLCTMTGKYTFNPVLGLLTDDILYFIMGVAF